MANMPKWVRFSIVQVETLHGELLRGLSVFNVLVNGVEDICSNACIATSRTEFLPDRRNFPSSLALKPFPPMLLFISPNWSSRDFVASSSACSPPFHLIIGQPLSQSRVHVDGLSLGTPFKD